MKNISSGWWEKLKAIEHSWGDPIDLEYYDGVLKKVRYCSICGAMKWEDETFGGSKPHYYSCHIMTDWPGDDEGPCFCTRRQYLEAHNII